MRIGLALFLYLQFCILLDQSFIKLCIDIDSRQVCSLWEDATLHLKFFLQLSHQVCSVYTAIGWNVFGSSFIVLFNFLSDYRLCLSFWDQIYWMDHRSLRLGFLRILDLCFLRTFFSCSQLLFLCIQLFLRFWFWFRIVQLRLLSDIVQIEQLFTCLCFSPKNFPQSLLLFKFLWIDFCIFHQQLMYYKSKVQQNFVIVNLIQYFFNKIRHFFGIFHLKINIQNKSSKIIKSFTMLAHNSFTIPFHTIQNDLSQLENQLLKFKLIISQSSLLNSSTQNNLNQQLASQLEAIHAVITKFCTKFDEEIRNVQNKLNLVMQISGGLTERKEWTEDQKYFIVTEKISMLQQSLKRTQQNENKLIETINILMAKYQIKDQPALIQSDQYLKSRIKTSQASSLITFQPCTGGSRQVSLEKISNSRENLKKTMKKNESNIYLLKDNNSYEVHNESPQYVRTFSKPSCGGKISLKQTAGAIQQMKLPSYSIKSVNQSYDLKDNRATSLDKHEHRFKFMINNLNY